MRRNLLIAFSLFILLSLIIATATIVNSGDKFRVSAVDPIALDLSSNKSTSAACLLENHNDTVFSFYGAIASDDRYATYINPSLCGAPPNYPFNVTDVSLTLLTFTGAVWPVSVDIEIWDATTSDSCGGPSALLCTQTVLLDSSTFAVPNVGNISLSEVCCVNGPFYVSVHYNGTTASPYPSVSFDSDMPADSCMNWSYVSGTWWKWHEIWAPPVPGNLIIWASGETDAPTCGPNVLINKIQPWQGSSGVGDSIFAMVEISNTGSISEDITGWHIAGDSWTDEDIALPSLSLPAGSYLEIRFGTGIDDFDFTDSRGTYYSGTTDWSFEWSGGEVGLFIGSPAPGALVDVVAWGEGSSSFGDSYTDALSSGDWSLGDYKDVTATNLLGLLARLPSGYDTNASTDWQIIELPFGEQTTPHNPIQLSPRDGSLISSLDMLIWRSHADATGYLLQVDTDSLFISPLISTTTVDTTFAVALADTVYYWRVIPQLTGGPYPAAIQQFELNTLTPAKAIEFGLALVPQKFQHKDSRLLCIWDLRNSKRPGCTEAAGAQGPWDAAHATGAHIPACRHCSQYCTRASIQAVVSKYAGTLLQDEISYHLKQAVVVGPEGDLGHGVGAWPQTNTSFSWALNNAGVTENFIAPDGPIPWATLKTEIDAGRPILTVVRPPGWFHTVVFDGYADIDGRRYIHMTDPWPGRTGWYRINTMPVVRYYTLAAGAVVGRNSDPNTTADSDGDGVVDFDEQKPTTGQGQVARPFHSVHNKNDTDLDQVKDKDEIRNYTFHDQAGYHPGHENDALNFPDIDGDNKRAENDCDSDNDSDFDGGEDINGDGNNPIPSAGDVCSRETCQFLASEFCLSVSVDKDTYFLGEPVYIVDQHNARTTHTYHQSSTYNYEKGDLCPTKANGSALGHDGSFTTDAGGHANRTLVEYCLQPGQRYLTVDVLDDNLYSTPDNLDPQTCWTCISDWFHGWHYGYDYTFHNTSPTFTYPLFEYPRVCEDLTSPTQPRYIVETPWWWWCYTWPPILDDYWLGVGIPIEFAQSGQLSISILPELTFESIDCLQPGIMQYNFDETVTLDLEDQFGGDGLQWFGFIIPSWQIPESLLTSRVVIDVQGGAKSEAAFDVPITIRAGDAVYGWSPTPYENIPIPVTSSACCVNRGNADGLIGPAGAVDVSDLTYLVAYLFKGGPPPPCEDEGNADGIIGPGGPIDVNDLTYIVAYLFKGGPPPPSC